MVFHCSNETWAKTSLHIFFVFREPVLKRNCNEITINWCFWTITGFLDCWVILFVCQSQFTLQFPSRIIPDCYSFSHLHTSPSFPVLWLNPSSEMLFHEMCVMKPMQSHRDSHSKKPKAQNRSPPPKSPWLEKSPGQFNAVLKCLKIVTRGSIFMLCISVQITQLGLPPTIGM